MKHRFRVQQLTFLSLFLSILTMTAPTFAADWPQWRGIHRDGKSPETDLLEQWPPEGPKLLWQVDGVGEGYASMAVSGERLYTTGMHKESSEGFVSAFDLSGNLVWQTEYGPEWIGSYAGARSCPAVADRRIFIVSGMGHVFCFAEKSGAILWSRDIAKDFAVESPRVGFAESPLVIDGKLICTPGGKDASLAALDAATGKTIWTTASLSDIAAYCSPILVERGDQRLIVTITARHLAGIDIATGHVVWREPFDTEAVDPNHSVSPIYQDGCIYITSAHRDGGCMYRLAPDGKSVTLGWTDTTLNCLHGGLVAIDHYVYGASNTGKWTCLDLHTGSVMYETRGVGMGSIIYADGMLYCYGEKGTLGLVKATPTEYQVVSSFKIPGSAGPHWAHPVISSGRLYIRYGNIITAYRIK